jgi:hypothetical protein
MEVSLMSPYCCDLPICGVSMFPTLLNAGPNQQSHISVRCCWLFTFLNSRIFTIDYCTISTKCSRGVMRDAREHLETEFMSEIWPWLVSKLFIFELNWAKLARIMWKPTQWSVHSGLWPVTKHLKCSIQSCLWPVTEHSVEMVQYHYQASSPPNFYGRLHVKLPAYFGEIHWPDQITWLLAARSAELALHSGHLVSALITCMISHHS